MVSDVFYWKLNISNNKRSFWLELSGYSKGHYTLNGLVLIKMSAKYWEAHFFGDTRYQQIIGGAMESTFTLILANIFMWKWEKETILPKLAPSHEIYGRYVSSIRIRI